MNLSCVQLTFTLVLTSTVAGIRPVINPYSGNSVNTNYNSNNNDEDSSSNNEVHLSTSRYNQELSREWREQQQRLGKNAFAPRKGVSGCPLPRLLDYTVNFSVIGPKSVLANNGVGPSLRPMK